MQVMPRNSICHLATRFRLQPRHRYQILHRHMRRDGTTAYLLLHTRRKKFDQTHAPRYPTGAAIKTPCQPFLVITEAIGQLDQQPTFFQSRCLLATAHRTIQQQSLRFTQRPEHRLDRVPAKLLQRGHPLVAIDHQIAIGLLGGHHDDRRLLPAGRQRRQQTAMPLRPMHPQVLQSPFKLVKFQMRHCRPPIRHYTNIEQAESGIARHDPVVSLDLPWNQHDKGITGIASHAAVVHP